jgi:polyhydroxyalkanoate synthesis regulator phasin
VHKACAQRLAELERADGSYHIELEHMRALRDVAAEQAVFWQTHARRRQLEVDQLTAAVRDLQAESDLQSIIGMNYTPLVKY